MGRQPDLAATAEIIAVGTELLSFGRSETNSLRIAQRLTGLGLTIRRKVVVPDVPGAISQALEQAFDKARVVIVTGGLGPTVDDVTRDAAAEMLGLPLREDGELVKQIFEKFERRGIRLPESNRRQAQVPEGARVLPNDRGTAPGLHLTTERGHLFLLPGPPRELYPMLDEQVVPLLRQEALGRPVPLRVLKVAGLAESRLDATIQPICRRYPGVETTILSSVGILSLYFVWKGREAAEGEARLDAMLVEIRRRLRRNVFSDREEGLVEVVARALTAQGRRLAVAESCTGGLVGKLLTDLAGSSSFFAGGVITYSNELKQKMLGVSEGVLERKGAVSRETARQMARGVRRLAGVDLGLAVTGIAGPDGGSEEKPVGLVYVAVADADGEQSRRLNLPGDRELIRRRSAWAAIDLVRRRLEP